MLHAQRVNEDRSQVEQVWLDVMENALPVCELVVSARSFLEEALMQDRPLNGLVNQHNIWKRDALETCFKGVLPEDTNSSTDDMDADALEARLNDDFHRSIPKIIRDHPKFIDQLKYLHFSAMNGNEAIMLGHGQKKRLEREKIKSIAGEIRTIQTGFSHHKFNSPRPEHLEFLLAVFTEKVEGLIDEVDEDTIYDFVSFAQYYFLMLHPVYERCGRISEELMYLLFEQTGEKPRYISNSGDRESTLTQERTLLLDDVVFDFNRRVASYLDLDTSDVKKTPDIYREITRKYFPEQFEEIYGENGYKPKGYTDLYYTHPIPKVIEIYYLVMEALLFDDMNDFDPKNPQDHIKVLGDHLREKGFTEYTYQSEDRIVVG